MKKINPILDEVFKRKEERMKRLGSILGRIFKKMVFLKGGDAIKGRIALILMLGLTAFLLLNKNPEASTYIPDGGSTLVHVQRSDDSTWEDVLGSSTFETYGFDYSQTGNNLEINIFTDYPWSGYTGVAGTSWHTTPGDLLIDVNRDGTYEYALALVGHNDGLVPDGIDDGTLVAGQLFEVTTWYLAEDYKPAGFTGYYGTNWRYESSPGTTYPAYVRGNGTNILGTEGVSWDPNPDPLSDYKVTLNLDVTHFLPPGFDDEIGILWGTATCANDVIAGNISLTNETTPEPGTWFMIGSGLIGLGAFSTKKKKQ